MHHRKLPTCIIRYSLLPYRSSSLALSASTHNFAGRVDLLKQSRASLHRSSSLPQLLPTYYVDLDSSCLYLYGEGALESLQDTGGHTHSQTVAEIQFHYIEFEELAPLLIKVSRNYPLVRVSEDCHYHCPMVSISLEITVLVQCVCNRYSMRPSVL